MEKMILRLSAFIMFSIFIACKKTDGFVSKDNELGKDDTIEKAKIKDNYNGYMEELNKEKINLIGSNKFLELTVEDIGAEINKYAFKIQVQKYEEKKFEEGIQISIKYRVKNIANEKLIFNDRDFYDYSLYIVSGTTDIAKLVEKFPSNSGACNSEIKEKDKFIFPYQIDEQLSHSLGVGEQFETRLKYFDNIDPKVKDLYFGGFFSTSKKGNLFRVFFKIEGEKVNGVYKYKITGKRFEEIDHFVNTHYYTPR